MAVDFEKEGLAEGLEGDAREARLKLLEDLQSQGFELDEMRQAADEGRLPLLAVERVVGGDQKYTADEIAEKSGLEREFLDRVWRSLGMPVSGDDEKAYTDADLEAVKAIGRVLEGGVSEDGLLEISKAMARSLSTLAAAIGRVFGQEFAQEGDTEHDLAERLTRASSELAPELLPTIVDVLSIQMREELRRATIDPEAIGRAKSSEEVAIAFADLVGFTRLGERIPPHELGAVASRLDELAAEVAQAPVRLVKTIGDAAMLASYNTDAVLKATLALVEAAENEGKDFPELRAGVAHGPALRRGGDWYGRPVNLASRITGLAKPDSVLASAEVKDAVEDDYDWSRAGGHKLRGVGVVELYRVRLPKQAE